MKTISVPLVVLVLFELTLDWASLCLTWLCLFQNTVLLLVVCQSNVNAVLIGAICKVIYYLEKFHSKGESSIGTCIIS